MGSQNMKFSDQYAGPVTVLKKRDDKTRNVTDTNDTELSDFFSRPVKIWEDNWEIGINISQVFDPWSLYIHNYRVENRLTTYNLFRGDLHLKVVVNGNGFYYGRAMLAYHPYYNSDDFSTTFDLMPLSQKPKVFVNPTTSTGGELVIPWHYYRNNGWMQNSSFAQELGSCVFKTINNLQHANGATESINVSVFAWLENVQLSGLTSMDVGGLTPQSGDETDLANEKGIVSGPASALSKTAATLSDLPVIGPYARATSKVAGMTSNIASMLGYCKPAITKAPEPYRPGPISSLANVNVPDTINKLSIDSKQELTIDPGISGVGDIDLLNIRSIASRESYLTKFTWPESAPHETLLFNMRVDPAQFDTIGSAYLFPACAMAVMPFQYWTGTMKIRFQIVGSTFHKGRLKFVYDPNELQGTEYNVNYMKIVDIASEQDITLELGVGQPDTLVHRAVPGVTAVTAMHNATPLSYSMNLGNGVLGVYVVNKLTSPNSVVPNDIEVNVYVSMGDDFEVFVPSSQFQQFVLEPQSGTVTIPESEHTEEQNAPVHNSGENIAVDFTEMPETNLVYTGEKIDSFRCLLKRYNKFTSFGPTNSSSIQMDYRANMFPFYRGAVSGAVHTAFGPVAYNFCNTVLLHWIRICFAGWRGAIRWKMLPRHYVGECIAVVSRHGGASTYGGYGYSSRGVPNYLSQDAIAADSVYDNAVYRRQTGTEGAAYTLSKVNPVLEWEMPYYSRYRFTHGRTEDITAGNNELDFFSIDVTSTQEAGRTSTVNTPGIFDLWVAAGEDFQVYMWLGAPRFYYEAVPPAAA